MKKTPIVVGDCPGFVVNRVFMNAANEILIMLEEGIPMEKSKKRCNNLGCQCPPSAVDEIGIDVSCKVAKQLEQAYGLA